MVMGLQKISLRNFRSYANASFELIDRNVVIGPNGSGKSNLVEAIYLLATGKSFRAEKDDEMIRCGEQLSIINSQFRSDDRALRANNSQIFNLQITITDRKKFEVNGIARRQMDFVGYLKAVMFGPGDMELVTGSPAVRRRYLDFVISQADREYRRCLISYEKGLRQRNKLLDLIRDGMAGRNQLFFWDKLLIKNGQYLTDKRAEFLAGAKCEYDKSEISEARFKQYEMEEVAAGSTLVGPHRDDFVFLRDGRDVSKYGSRGEQRMSVWELKQYEIKYLGDEPVLLLDDIFSELDHKRREAVIEFVKKYPGQVIMTTADEHLIPVIKNANIIKL